MSEHDESHWIIHQQPNEKPVTQAFVERTIWRFIFWTVFLAAVVWYYFRSKP